MQIVDIKLKDFRNYESEIFDFKKGLNVIFGRNASGKTNVLESIYLASIFHSPRTTKDKEMIRIGATKAEIKITIQKRFRQHQIFLQINDQGQKKVAIDKIPIARAGELLGVLGVVYFSPDEMKIVKDAPSERRKMVDIGISQQQKSYFYALQKYTKILKQKNNMLKDIKMGAKRNNEILDVWDKCLALEGAIIIKKRIEYIQELSREASKIHSKLSEDKEVLQIYYEMEELFAKNSDKIEQNKDEQSEDGDIKKVVQKSVDTKEIETELFKKIVLSREKDIKLGYTTVGPHRDDICFEINGSDSRKYASQGQQRTIALSLKLSEVELFFKTKEERPILLLDDVLSELDEKRKAILLDHVTGYQTILTCTEYSESVDAHKINISNGKIVK